MYVCVGLALNVDNNICVIKKYEYMQCNKNIIYHIPEPLGPPVVPNGSPNGAQYGPS